MIVLAGRLFRHALGWGDLMPTEMGGRMSASKGSSRDVVQRDGCCSYPPKLESSGRSAFLRLRSVLERAHNNDFENDMEE